MSAAPLHIFVPHCSDVLTDHLPNGDGLVAYGFIKHLAERGHVLHVVAMRAELKGRLPPNVDLTVITPRSGDGIFARLEYMVRLRRHFNRLRRSTRLDLVHQLNPVFTGPSLALWNVDLPTVLGTYVARWPDEADGAAGWGGLPLKLSNALREWLSGIQQKHADVLLLASPAARNRLPHPESVEAKIRWLGHGVDTEMFSPPPDAASPERLEIEQSRPSVLFLASIAERKGVFPLLHAFKQVLAQLPQCRLTFAGDGPDMQRARDLAGELGIAGNADFLGRVPRSAAPDLFRNHAVYCLPAFGEPYATSVLEAMSCGRPLVITDSGGVPYMVPEDGGLRVPPGDADALAQALLRLLGDAELRCRMGLANRAHVLRSMTWPKIIEDLEAIYREVLARHTTRT